MTIFNDVQIVVARYNENLQWILEPPFNQFQYIVYNKGINDDFIKSDNIVKVVSLPNVGRCDHTYLYHMVHNYHSLAPITVFLPGSVNNECKKSKARHLLESIIAHKSAVFLGHKTNNLFQQFKNFTLDHWTCTDGANAALNSESALHPAVLRPFGKWFSYHFGNIHVTHWCIHGIFSVHKYDILKTNVNKYKQLLAATSVHSNPEVGHYIERSWAAIFHPFVFTKVL